ncbi:hypothetical protein ACJMK2_039572 [Sinanodonta woodiana]|uniref:C1q domain-containing protein n=1 Tax=Sinanodonta woodiana TaxID=1069815 RepID=A0ABD3WCF6_SINWO
MSLELIRLSNEQRKMNAVIAELQETWKELLTSNAELLKTQNKLLSSQSELHSRIKDLEDEANHFKIKDRMRRIAPSNVGFTARLSNSITSGLSTHQILVFDNVYINVGNGYDALTGVFRAPVAGMYVILMTVSSISDYWPEDIEVVHNGEVLCRAVATQLHYGGCPCNAVVLLKVGDAVWARVINYRSYDHVRGEYYTTFSMGLMIKDDDGGSSF